MDRTKVVFMHLIVWLLYVSIVVFNLGYADRNWSDFIYETAISHIISAGVFYALIFWILPKYYANKKYFYTVIGFLVILTISVIARFIYTYIVSPDVVGRTISSSSLPLDTQTVNFSFQWFKFSLFAILYWSKTSKIALQKRLAEQMTENSKREKLELENAALRSQINPHFIFNTLEVLRRESSKLSQDLSYGIACFMNILRSGINKPGPDGKIPLFIEIRAIEGLVYLFTKRFPDLEVIYLSDIDSDHGDRRIYSHVLLPLVENAFKHGDKEIKIELSVSKSIVKLKVYNITGRRIKDESTGIGLAYVKRHLELNYPKTHNLSISQTYQDYSADLTINLN